MSRRKRKSMPKRRSKRDFARKSHHHPRNSRSFSARGGIRL